MSISILAQGHTVYLVVLYVQISLVNPAASDQYRMSTEDYMKVNFGSWTSVAGATGIAADNLKSANRP